MVTYTSPPSDEPHYAAAKRRRAASAANVRPAIPADLLQAAARRAFFGVSNAVGTDVFGESDDRFVQLIQTARRIYRPHGYDFSLVEYSRLTRNFMAGFLRTEALTDPHFQQLWEDVAAYEAALEKAGLTDSVVETVQMQAATDVMPSSVAAVVAESSNNPASMTPPPSSPSSSVISQDHADIRAAIRAALAPSDAVSVARAAVAGFGALAHAPVGMLSRAMAARYGVEKDGDRSVEATVKILAGFLGLCLYYPFIGVSVAAVSSTPLAAPAVVATLAASGWSMAQYRDDSVVQIAALRQALLPQAAALTDSSNISSSSSSTGDVNTTVPALNADGGTSGAVPPLSTVGALLQTRIDLQTRLRHLTDRHAPVDQKGWWRHNLPVLVSQSDLVAARMSELSIPLKHRTRTPNEHAVLTFKQRGRSSLPGSGGRNKRALLWLPGWNDSFFHVHLLPELLEGAGCDVFALDLRRCGRARMGTDGQPVCKPDMAHDSADFTEYFEELDAVFEFLQNPSPLPLDTHILQEGGGCGQEYDEIILYAHSTGALVGALYAKLGQHGDKIARIAFNSPFWAFNLPWYQAAVVSRAADMARVLGTAAAPKGRGGRGGGGGGEGGGEGGGSNFGVDGQEKEEEGTISTTTILTSNTSDMPNAGNAVVLQAGGELSEYSSRLREQYHFGPEHKNLETLTVTAGWVSAVSRVQNMLREGELELEKDCLVLWTSADKVLRPDDIDRLSNRLVWSSNSYQEDQEESHGGSIHNPNRLDEDHHVVVGNMMNNYGANNNTATANTIVPTTSAQYSGAAAEGRAAITAANADTIAAAAAAAAAAATVSRADATTTTAEKKRVVGECRHRQQPRLIEREIESSEWAPSAHDVLAAPSQRRVDEAMSHLVEWILSGPPREKDKI